MQRLTGGFSSRLLTLTGWFLLAAATLLHTGGTWSAIGPDLDILGGRSAEPSALTCALIGYLPFALPILFVLVFGWWQIFEGLRTQHILIGRAMLIFGSWAILLVYQILPIAQFLVGFFWQFGDWKVRLLRTCLMWC